MFPRSSKDLIKFKYSQSVHTHMDIAEIMGLLGVRVSHMQAHKQRQSNVMDQLGWLPMFQRRVSEEGFEEFSHSCK